MNNIFAFLFEELRTKIIKDIEALDSAIKKALEPYREGIEAINNALEEIRDKLFDFAAPQQVRRSRQTRATRLREVRKYARVWFMRIPFFQESKPRRGGRRMGGWLVWAVNFSCFGTCRSMIRRHGVAAVCSSAV